MGTPMSDANEVWRRLSDEQLIVAAQRVEEYTDEGRNMIRAELRRRGIAEPAIAIPTESGVSATAAADRPGELLERACTSKIYGLSPEGAVRSARTVGFIFLGATLVGCLFAWGTHTGDWTTESFQHVGGIPILGFIAQPFLAVIKKFPLLPFLFVSLITVAAAVQAVGAFREAVCIGRLPSMSVPCPRCGARLEVSAYYSTQLCDVVCPGCYALLLGPFQGSLRKRSCARCGLHFFAAADPAKCPSCRFATGAPLAKCPQCGQEQREGAVYCSSCDSWIAKEAFADVLSLSPKVAAAYLNALLTDVGGAVEQVVVPLNCEAYGPNGLWPWLKDQLSKLEKATLVIQWLSAAQTSPSLAQMEKLRDTVAALRGKLARPNLERMREEHRQHFETAVTIAERTVQQRLAGASGGPTTG